MTTDYDPTAFKIDFDPTHARMRGTAIHGNTPFDVSFISEIVPGFWQGGCESGLILPPFIDHLISLYKWEAYTVAHDLKSTRTITMYDSSDEPNRDEVLEIAAYVNACRKTGVTLVHCQAGLNRSGLIAATALWLDGMTMGDAIALLRDRRSPAVLCNQTFEAWLRDLER